MVGFEQTRCSTPNVDRLQIREWVWRVFYFFKKGLEIGIEERSIIRDGMHRESTEVAFFATER